MDNWTWRSSLALSIGLVLISVIGIGYGARASADATDSPLAAPDQSAADRFLSIHRYLAFLTVLVIGMHVGAALFHYLIRKDGVLKRMLPWAGRLS